MSDNTAYPLQWPEGWPITQNRESARFKTDLAQALRNLKHEVDLMGGKGLILSSNYMLGVEKPKHPGVVAYFDWSETKMAIPCDRWNTIAANVQAIALTIDAMRGMERWGAKHMIKAMFSGFKQLPAGAARARPWWDVMGVSSQESAENVAIKFRALAGIRHPDKGGSTEAMTELNMAMLAFKKERGL